MAKASTTMDDDPSGSMSADDEDFVFNMIDSYSAILCSAFMHCKVFDALCDVGTNASGKLATRARDLLVTLTPSLPPQTYTLNLGYFF